MFPVIRKRLILKIIYVLLLVLMYFLQPIQLAVGCVQPKMTQSNLNKELVFKKHI